MTKKRKLRINPGPGDEVQSIVAQHSSGPAAVIERARQAIKPRCGRRLNGFGLGSRRVAAIPGSR